MSWNNKEEIETTCTVQQSRTYILFANKLELPVTNIVSV